MMRIDPAERVSSFPPLAWCARLRRGDDRVTLRCGAGVELWQDRAFFEGAWAGDFTAADFDGVPDVFGSGAVAGDERITFVTPSHTCERLQLLRDGDSLWVSNSLCLLLESADARLSNRYAGYAREFEKIVYGIDHAVTPIPAFDGRRVELVYFKNVSVDSRLDVTYVDKPAAETFTDYESYKRLLIRVLSCVAANASDVARTMAQYELLTSVSSGYDSAACAALAKQIGCRRAVTLTRARGPSGADDESDSGADVARAMGLDVIERERLHYQSMPDACPEAEFLATGMSGEDVNMLALEDQLPGALFLTGFHGDKIWDKDVPANAVLRRGDLSGASLNEFRLRVNLVHVPVPFIAGLRHARLRAIANSREMSAWSVAGDYDRPVPRRLAEEAGAPRGAFGRTKKATTALLHLEGLSAMSLASRREIVDFVARSRVPLGARVAVRADALVERAGALLSRALRKAKLLRFVPPLKRHTFDVHSHTTLGPLPFLWAVQRIRQERYAAATTGSSEPASLASVADAA